jgi:hypothetical protein
VPLEFSSTLQISKRDAAFVLADFAGKSMTDFAGATIGRRVAARNNGQE